MIYGDELCVEITEDLHPDEISPARLGSLFRNARRLTKFASTPDHNFIHDLTFAGFDGSLCYRIDKDRMIEINDAELKSPIAIRNQVADIISFQFVSTVKRSEFLGKRKNVHDLGPALIVSAVPEREITYRVPKANVQIRHVVVHTTLSNLMQRLAESLRRIPGLAQGDS
jgi:hypothetical protein